MRGSHEHEPKLNEVQLADPGRLYYHSPWVPTVAVIKRARQWARLLALDVAKRTAAAAGYRLVPATELHWRRKKQLRGPVCIARQRYYLVPEAEADGGGN